jgi:hypothetical protein
MGMGKKLADASIAKIASLENRLSGVLKPVAPRGDFVHGLGRRIQTGSRASLVNNVINWNILAAVIAALVSVAVLLGIVVRVLLMISGKKRTA